MDKLTLHQQRKETHMQAGQTVTNIDRNNRKLYLRRGRILRLTNDGYASVMFVAGIALIKLSNLKGE